MKKGIWIMICLFFISSIIVVGKEENEEELTGNIDFPIEYTGVIYGEIYGNVIPPNPETPPHVTSESDLTADVFIEEKQSQEMGSLYELEEGKFRLKVYKNYLELAKKENKNISLYLYDKDGKLRYRIRILVRDINNLDKIEDITFNLEGNCEHRSKITSIVKENIVVSLLLCQEDYGLPVYFGIYPPDEWNNLTNLKQYGYDVNQDRLFLQEEKLILDKNKMIELMNKGGSDILVANKNIPLQRRTMKRWVDGLRGESNMVSQPIAIASLFAGFLSLSALLGSAILYWKKINK